jgi:hypothetical protein
MRVNNETSRRYVVRKQLRSVNITIYPLRMLRQSILVIPEGGLHYVCLERLNLLFTFERGWYRRTCPRDGVCYICEGTEVSAVC